MLTIGGTHVTWTGGCPSVSDISNQLMRICRFGGAVKTFWPTGMHSLLVADLAPVEIEHHSLLHDCIDAISGDVPRPFKTAEQRAVEHMLLERVYQHLGLAPPTEQEEKLIKIADNRAAVVEGCLIGPRGFKEAHPDNGVDDPDAFRIMEAYLADYSLDEVLTLDGRWPREYERRLRLAITVAQLRETGDPYKRAEIKHGH